jgi:hypothetical protein
VPVTCSPPAVPRVSEERGFARDDHAPARARRFVRARLAEWGLDHLVPSAELVVSELVTNSVQNAPGDQIAVRLDRCGGAVRVRVRDDSPALPRQRAVDAGAVSGRGLVIVDALSLEWGSCPVPGGKVTWATITEGGS